MNIADVKPDLRVRATNVLRRWHRLLVSGPNLRARKEGMTGTVWKALPCHDGAWWVRQDDGKVGAYWFHELEPIPAEQTEGGYFLPPKE